MWSATGFCPGAASTQYIYNDLPLHIANSKVVCDVFADGNSINSCGTYMESVQCCLHGRLK